MGGISQPSPRDHLALWSGPVFSPGVLDRLRWEGRVQGLPADAGSWHLGHDIY